ncbi:four helix bundle protein [Algoriphagus boritolerans]|uniref:Four helix bundle protein n=1 Tax=Algoriphagus boritolerans DSM 17298 = JCM 18970 TaxID=1120964 RepID=A0A1H5RZ89_9BACT|nr:four helix bundle protein [Algoriphagus boritolerans]SEF43682.1 four helix bundle protein [Algoriphagus boritolerans DSM 17298 = JCM 18970]
MENFKFEKLRIWHSAMDFGELIFDTSARFPTDEKYNLTSQIRRAADSIALNIAEGSTGQSHKEFRKFIGYSLRSLAEVVTCLHKAKRRKYLNEEEFSSFYSQAFTLMNSIGAFRATLVVKRASKPKEPKT